MFDRGDRGQAHTLEGIVAAIVLLSSLVYALQVTAVTPLSASTASQHIENQEQATARGFLAATEENGELRDMLLYYNGTATGEGFHGTGQQPSYTNDFDFPDEFAFGRTLNETFSERGIAANVLLYPQTSDGVVDTPVRMVYRGAPSDNAVTASKVVTLYDDELLLEEDGTESSKSVENADTFYTSYDAPGRVYNVVRVEVVVWRM